MKKLPNIANFSEHLRFRLVNILNHHTKGMLAIMAFLVLPSCSQLKPIKVFKISAESRLNSIDTLDVYSDNGTLHVLLSGSEQNTDSTSVQYFNSSDEGHTWSTPVIVNPPKQIVKPSKRGNDFQIAAKNNKVMAIWRKQGAEPWVGIISSSYSTDNGKTWKTIPSPVNQEFSSIDQGYFGLAADLNGHFHLTWLDDRNEAGDTQVLRYAKFTNNDVTTGWNHHYALENTACTCCWSSVATDLNGGVHILFRDDEPRDMMLTSSLNSGQDWQAAQTVWPFNWSFIGCPHQGGSVITTQADSNVIKHSVIWNGHKKSQGVYYKSSNENTKPVLLSDHSGRSADIAHMENPQYIASVYTISEAGQKTVVSRISEDGGINWGKELRLSKENAEPSHPKVVATKHGFRYFWTEWQNDGTAIAIMAKIDV